MNNDIAIIHLINRLEQIEANTRQPVSWVWALIVANWTIKGGHRTFMKSEKMQDLALIKLTNFNIKQGYRMRVLKKGSSLAKIAGFAKAAHLKGVGAAKRWYKYGKDSKDGNGTKTSKYAADGERLFD